MRYLIFWMVCHLQAKPRIGVYAGMSSTGILAIQKSFFSHDVIMQFVTDISICASCIVAVCSAVAWIIKVYRAARNERPAGQ